MAAMTISGVDSTASSLNSTQERSVAAQHSRTASFLLIALLAPSGISVPQSMRCVSVP